MRAFARLLDRLSLTQGRNAKLTLLRSGSYSKPFYWAPFQLYTGS